MTKTKLIVVMIIVLLVVSACHSNNLDVKDKYQYTFRLAEAHPLDHPTTIADLEFARRVEEETDGRIKIVVYANKALGEEREVIEQVGFGAIDFARVSIAPFSEIVPELNVLQLPYLYENSEHMWEVLDSEIGDYFLDSVEDKGYLGLNWFDAGARNFYNTNKAITKLDDLKGQTIRVMESSLMLDMIEALGANGTMLTYGQVYSGLQTGLIDGAENNYPSFVTASHLEVAKYYTVDEHVRVPEIVVASKTALEHISDDDWAIIKKVAVETKEYQKQLYLKKDQEFINDMIEAGVEIYYLEDKSEFIEAVEPIYDKYKDYEPIIEEIRMMGLKYK